MPAQTFMCVPFPILGKLHVVGLTVNEVQDLVRNKIMEGKYIKDPLVTMEFENFKYTILGEIGGNGTYTVDDGRITLLQAIANAGDIAPNGNIRRVLVYREENGVRKMYSHDLRTNDIFYSPCYYLQQNDLVYVEPKRHKYNETTRVTTTISLIMSFVSMLSLLAWAFK